MISMPVSVSPEYFMAINVNDGTERNNDGDPPLKSESNFIQGWILKIDTFDLMRTAKKSK